MNGREEYQQEKQANLDELTEELAELNQRISTVNVDGKMELNKEKYMVESKIKDAKAQLKAVINASDEEIASHKKDVDDTFRSLYSNLARG